MKYNQIKSFTVFHILRSQKDGQLPAFDNYMLVCIIPVNNFFKTEAIIKDIFCNKRVDRTEIYDIKLEELVNMLCSLSNPFY